MSDGATQYDEPPFPDHPHPNDDVAPVRPLHTDTPPHNIEAEQNIIGAALQSQNAYDTLATRIQPTHFYRYGHELIWQTLNTLAADGQPIEVTALLTHLQAHKLLTKVGGGPYLHTLYAAATTLPAAQYYATQVIDHARRRKGIQAAHRVAQRLNSLGTDTDHALAEALQDFDDTVTQGSTAGQSTVNYVPFNGLFTKPRTPIQWVIAPLLAAGRVTLLYSPGKTGKSLIAIEAAAAVATGRPAIATTKRADPQHVLYIDQEMTEDDWIDRLADMGYDTTDEQYLATHLHLAQLQSWPPMDTAAGGRAVEQAAKHTKATVVIIDTASKVIAGEENSNDTQQAFYRHTLIPLKRAGIAVLVLDHTGKDLDRGARGGSAKTDNIDLAFELLRRGKDLLTLRCTHARVRDQLLEEPVFLRRTTGPLTHAIETGHTSGEAGPGLRPTYLMEMVSRYVEANPGASKTAIETAVKGKGEYVRLALELLVMETYIQSERGPRNTQMHTQIKPFREDQDAQI